MFRYMLAMGLVSSLVGCASTQMNVSELRAPAGTGDVDSSQMSEFGTIVSYKLPITRNGKQTTRVASSYWVGEWPMPMIDVLSDFPGTTKISAYTNLRNPREQDKVACTIKNGVYHPWSNNDPSAANYYTLSDVQDYKALRDVTYSAYSYKQKKEIKMKIPKGALITNVVYGSEGYCSATLKIGKTLRSIDEACSFFMENKDFQKISADDNFSEQWIYMTCEEKDSSGRNVKAFVQDKSLQAEPGVKDGCPKAYGVAGSAKDCSAN
ncbi:MAG: hypothetical protein JSU04_18090 [Bdellovibrionales bacterium]|nr:hypothetical protein [Bdellovibrionales bacterium]